MPPASPPAMSLKACRRGIGLPRMRVMLSKWLSLLMMPAPGFELCYRLGFSFPLHSAARLVREERHMPR